MEGKGDRMVYKLNEKKEIRIPDKDIERLMKSMDIDQEEAIEIWLDDEGYTINEEQEELCKAAKDNKVLASLHRAKDMDKKPKQKTQKERVAKPNPTKEMVISKIAEMLPSIAENVVVENKGKIITFSIDGNDYKLDLVQHRKPKEVK